MAVAAMWEEKVASLLRHTLRSRTTDNFEIVLPSGGWLDAGVGVIGQVFKFGFIKSHVVRG